MGITGELVRSVFSKSRSIGTNDTNVRSNAMEKRKWSSVRSYLCGDEFNSVLAEEDSASVRSSEATISQPTQESSEATVTQPILEDLIDKGDIQSKETKEKVQKEKQNSTAKLFCREDAAIVIQTAFRGFLARRRNDGLKLTDGKQEIAVGTGSPSKESVGTSLEVQTGNSTEVFSIQEGSIAMHHRLLQKARTQVMKLKEEWDDSTVSSNISKMRIQNRLEATTRRERALAYAFSQQLRICSKKKQTRSEGKEPNMGWSWLERWMATRLSEGSSVDGHINKQLERSNSNQRSMVRKRLFDVAGEEKESCGSNEVPVQIDSILEPAPKERDYSKLAKNRVKATRSVSRRKTVPSYHYPKEHPKVNKKDCAREEKKDKKHKQKQKQPGIEREIKCKDATSQLSLEVVTSNNSKLGF
ncbi:hypothetical protein F0562_011200 [Nyssa sinensis]|uniref:DUF4005 domain-containing protein n=1 Tax=Nyssa sinensis TaxID=561372 RepID=A0A5J5A606_9ASTE|nr:hypothetical protein F0562_011200 [Nyssa sinensis]